MNNSLDFAKPFAGAAIENAEPTPAQKEVFDLIQLLSKGFPKLGRAASDAPCDFSKDLLIQSIFDPDAKEKSCSDALKNGTVSEKQSLERDRQNKPKR